LWVWPHISNRHHKICTRRSCLQRITYDDLGQSSKYYSPTDTAKFEVGFSTTDTLKVEVVIPNGHIQSSKWYFPTDTPNLTVVFPYVRIAVGPQQDEVFDDVDRNLNELVKILSLTCLALIASLSSSDQVAGMSSSDRCDR